MSTVKGRTAAVRIALLAWLTVVYIALWGEISVANVVAGLAIGTLIIVALPMPRIPVRGRFHPLSGLELLGVSIYYSVLACIQVAWLAVRPAPPPVAGVLRVHLSIQSDLVLVLCMDLLNLIPGTIVLEVDRGRCVLYVHVLDVSTDAAVTEFYRTTRKLERLLIKTFERPSERIRATGEAES